MIFSINGAYFIPPIPKVQPNTITKFGRNSSMLLHLYNNNTTTQ